MHKLPDLPYAHDALEPTIDARTMEIHHGKHHALYVSNLNAALDGQDGLAGLGIENLMRQIDSVPESVRMAVRNNGGGHANHTMFWSSMSPDGGGAPGGALGGAIDASFGGYDSFKEEFQKAGMTRFGSGWAWLVATDGGGLAIQSTPNQDTPLMEGKNPILGVDVWEHAYYLNYQNRRADYLAAFWDVVDWAAVGARYSAAEG